MATGDGGGRGGDGSSADAGSRGGQTGGAAADATPTNRTAWTVVVFAAMALFGAVMMVRGPVVPELRASFDAPSWQLGAIPTAGTAGYLLAFSVVGFGAGQVRPRRFVSVGLAGTALAVIGMGTVPSLPLFLVAVACQGAAVGAVRAINRPLLSHFYPSSRGRVYSIYDMTWAVGAALGPLLVVAALRYAGWRYVFWLLGLLLAALAAWVWTLSEPAVQSEEQPFGRSDVLGLLRRPQVLAMTAVMVFATGLEGGLFLWLPTYADGELPGWLASATLTCYVAAYVPGRFAWSRLTERVGELRLLVAVFGALVPVYLLTFWVADGLWLLPGIVGVGLLASATFPLLTAHATDAAPEFSGPVSAVAAVTSSLGVGVVPALLGVAISGSGVGFAMELLAIPIVVGFALVTWALLAERRRERAAARGDSQPGD